MTLPFQAIKNIIINKLYYKGGFNKRRKRKREKEILPMGSPSNPSTHLQVLHSSTLLGSYPHSHLAPALTSTHPCTRLPQPALAPTLPHSHLPSRTRTYPPALAHTRPHAHLPSRTRTYPPALAPTLPHSHLPARTRTYPPRSHLPPALTSTTSSSSLSSRP